jgi:predicted nucleotidyltransferase
VTGNANRQGSNKNSLLSEMLRMRLRFALRLLAALPPLGLGACADTMTAGQPLASSTELLRDYDKTLTKSEQKAAIDELKNDQEKAAKEESEAPQDAPAPAPAQPAAKQD